MGARQSQCSSASCVCCQSESADGAVKMVEVQEMITPGMTMENNEYSPEKPERCMEDGLKALVREFAHSIVGPGLMVKSRIIESEEEEDEREYVSSVMKTDRRISNLELWPIPKKKRKAKIEPMITMPFPLIQQFRKDSPKLEKLKGKEGLLTIYLKNDTKVHILFDSPQSRDDAHTCLRIFQAAN
mmetsp:Transcript_26274/g.45677  ORF Transcript_26274/g.45677 Transcript_26274/m.45677 type:complete len:186 (+) Transcript_26274:175-732(+)